MLLNIFQKNKEIADKKIGFKPDKYFLIIEYEIPLFSGEFEKYADLFEFMDVPGLNEKVKSKNTNKNKEERKNKNRYIKETKVNSIEENFYFTQIFPFIKMNIIKSLFIFDAGSYKNTNVIEIIDTYIKRINNYENDIDKFRRIYNSKIIANKKENRRKELKEKYKNYNSNHLKIHFLF